MTNNYATEYEIHKTTLKSTRILVIEQVCAIVLNIVLIIYYKV